ncbi:phage tail assembly chaperone [Pseudomonas corrugata]
MKYAIFDPVSSVLIGRFDGDRCQVPEGAVEITEETYHRSIAERDGQWILSVNGDVIKAPLPDLTIEQLAGEERSWRDNAINGSQWISARHRDQLEIGIATSMTAEQFQELLVYIQALRDWPQSKEFPKSDFRPAAPQWIKALQ